MDELRIELNLPDHSDRWDRPPQTRRPARPAPGRTSTNLPPFLRNSQIPTSILPETRPNSSNFFEIITKTFDTCTVTKPNEIWDQKYRDITRRGVFYNEPTVHGEEIKREIERELTELPGLTVFCDGLVSLSRNATVLLIVRILGSSTIKKKKTYARTFPWDISKPASRG